MENSQDIRELFPEEIGLWLESQGEKGFRGRQIFRWLQVQCARSYEEMTDIPKALQAMLVQSRPIRPLKLVKELVSRDGTRKYLFELNHGQRIESVLMTHLEASGHKRHTLCVSTQAGCAMGCTFCTTGKGGFFRNLTAGEITGQVLDVTYARRQEDPQFYISNVVYMGMGEPLLNYEAVVRSIRILNHPLGQKIGIRRITLSTCGMPDQIRRLAKEGLDIVLALSLHSPDDALRSRLMPVNRRYPLKEVMEAVRDYAGITGRRITFEYILIKGVNDSPEHARSLCQLLKGLPCNVNIIPVNNGDHGFIKPGSAEQTAFKNALKKCGIEAVIREEKGADIHGACGQLAGRVDV